MKKILFSAVSALAIAGVAVAADSTEFGVLYVPSSANETIVSVPWLASGTGSVPVAVADLVLTAGLAVGDELMLYNSGTSYSCWVLSDEGGRHWEPGTTVSSSKISAAAGANTATLDRGQAIILRRTNPGDGFYIMGKPATLTAAEKTLSLAAGELNNPVFTLIAPPLVDAVTPNSLTWTGLTAGLDKLVIGMGTTLTWKGDTKKWGTAGDTALTAGTGVWFKSEGTGTKSVKWQD